MTPETKQFNEWSNQYRDWMLQEFFIGSPEHKDRWEIGFKAFKSTLPTALKPLAIALENAGFDSTAAWKAVGNPLATDIETTLDQVWVLARRFDATSEDTDAPVDGQDNEPDAIASVRAIVNKVRKMKKLSQSEKGAKIASQVDDELFVEYIAARGLKTKVEDKVSHFTRLVQDCDGAKGVPQWLKG